MIPNPKEKRKNSVFGEIISPLITPMYILQMARSKTWSKEAQYKHLRRFATACETAKRKAWIEMENLRHDPTWKMEVTEVKRVTF